MSAIRHQQPPVDSYSTAQILFLQLYKYDIYTSSNYKIIKIHTMCLQIFLVYFV